MLNYLKVFIRVNATMFSSSPLKRLIVPTAKLAPSGFTLLELAVVVLIAGVLAAIGAAGWLSFMNRQRVRTAAETAMAVLQQARSSSQQQRREYQASFRELNGVIQYAVHPASDIATNALWQTLSADVQLDIDETTFKQSTAVSPTVYRVQFTHQGFLKEGIGGQGRIVFEPKSQGDDRACVFMSTLLGMTRLTYDDKCL